MLPYLVHSDTLLKNARDVITKCDKILLQIVSKCNNSYKMHRLYYKMRYLLQNVASVTKCFDRWLIKITQSSARDDAKTTYVLRL